MCAVWCGGCGAVKLTSANSANRGLCGIIGASKTVIVVVAIHGHLLAKPRVILTIIHELGVTSRGRDTCGVSIGLNTAG